jgi:hypothetical protein
MNEILSKYALVKPYLFLCFKNILKKKLKIFYFFSLLQINMFLIFLNHFDVFMLKIIFKN